MRIEPLLLDPLSGAFLWKPLSVGLPAVSLASGMLDVHKADPGL